MNFPKFSTLAVVLMTLSLAATGCKTRKIGPTPLGSRSGAYGDGRPTELSGGIPIGRPGEEVWPVEIGGGPTASFDPDQMHQDRAALAAHTVYFDYDSSAVRPGDEAKVDAVAAVLASDLSAKLLIEGHCDERGTEEYNRSLGERRALAVRQALAMRGVDPARVATRSYGEDRPADPGYGEAAWSRNRRAEFVLLHPQ